MKTNTMYYFGQTPGGKILRSLWVAYMQVQGAFKADGGEYSIWPAANFSGHVAKCNIVKLGGSRYRLTPQGYGVITTEAKHDPQQIADLSVAILSGKAPSWYNFTMTKFAVPEFEVAGTTKAPIKPKARKTVKAHARVTR